MGALNILRMFCVTGTIAALAACGRSTYIIDGTVDTYGFEGKTLTIVEFTPHSSVIHDSCLVSHGKFGMKGMTDDIRLVFLCRDDQPIMPLYLESGRVRVIIQTSGIQCSGTRQNDLLSSFLMQKKPLDNMYDDVWRRRMEMLRSGSVDRDIMSRLQDSLQSIVSECENLIYSFITSNYNEKASVGVFAMLTVNPGTRISTLMKRILDEAPEDFLENPAIKDYIQRAGYVRIR